MLKILARIWAKIAYRWKLEVEERNNDLHAKLAALHAQQKQKYGKYVDAIGIIVST
jgi:hypothetical protein